MSHLRITDPDGFRLTIGPKIAGRTPNPDRIELLVDAPEGDGIAVDLSPLDASEVAHTLAMWAAQRGWTPTPWPASRWSLPDPDLLAVLVERVVTGEDPTAENFDRYRQAYREALTIAHALPSVLGLLEELNQPEGCGPECSEMHTFAGRCELGARAEEVSRAIVDERPDLVGRAQPSEVPHCAGRAANPHERVPMVRTDDGWRCTECQLHDLAASVDDFRRGIVDADDFAAETLGVTYPKAADLRFVLDTLDFLVVDAGTKHQTAALLDAAARLRQAVDAAERTRAEYVAVVTEPTTRTIPVTWHPDAVAGALALFLDWRDCKVNNPPSPNCQQIAVAIDALRAVTGEPEDLVEDEDGAPLPLAVQVLIRTAQDLIVEREAPAGSVSHLADRMTDLRVALDTVLAESRR